MDNYGERVGTWVDEGRLKTRPGYFLGNWIIMFLFKTTG